MRVNPFIKDIKGDRALEYAVSNAKTIDPEIEKVLREYMSNCIETELFTEAEFEFFEKKVDDMLREKSQSTEPSFFGHSDEMIQEPKQQKRDNIEQKPHDEILPNFKKQKTDANPPPTPL